MHLHSILGGVRIGDYLSSIDLWEAYLHVPIRPSHRRFLRFCYGGAFPAQGPSPSTLRPPPPRIFTKLLDVVAVHLRASPIRLQCYLDDILIQSSSFQQAHTDLQETISALQLHGFTVNWEKSQLIPSTDLVHLGTHIDTQAGLMFVSQERQHNIRATVAQVRSLHTAPLLMLSQLLGQMISCLSIVPWVRLHS